MRGIRVRLILQFSIILLLIVVLLEGVFVLAVRSYYFGTAMETLTARAATSATFYNKFLEDYPLKDRARYILENLSLKEYAKIEILDPSGKVVVNSYGFSPSDTVTTPDVAAALKGREGTYIGRAPQSGERILAVSNPLQNLGATIGVIRFSVSAEPLYTAVASISMYAAGVGVLAILLGFALSLLTAKRIVGPIQELTNIAGQMATGNFAVRAAKRHEDEVGTLAESLNFMAEELAKNEKLKNDFISSVSHELRTPLTSIKGWGETLISGGLGDAGETLQGVEVISRETERLIGLVEELLDFSKFQSGEMKLVEQQFDLRGLLEEIRLQYGFRNNGKNISLQVEIPQQPLPLEGDPNRLKQVFVNLLDNAFKFTPPHGSIRLSASRTDTSIVAEVADTGEGIAPEDLPKVAEKFYKGSSKQSGSGLGLAICKGIVQLHEGSFRVESELGKGTTVKVELPLCLPTDL
jgi:signal transduction histidine kinase